MSTQNIISINNITKNYGKKQILKEMSFKLEQPEILGLLGPSGAGKTTLVKIIAGLEEATTGSVTLLEQQMPNLHMMERIGYMAQSDALYDELTALENLQFFARIYGLKGRERHKRIDEVLSLVNLTNDKRKKVNNFSGGMKRRLSLAIALVHNPDILILDEPTVGIDPVLRNQIWRQLNALKNNGVTIIVTTHVMDEAERCNHLGMLRSGRLIALGTPEELKKETKAVTLEQAFLHFGGESYED